MKSSYSGFPEGLPIKLEPSGPNFAPHPIAVCDERVTDSRILNFCRLFAEYEKKASAMRLRQMHKFFLERDLNCR